MNRMKKTIYTTVMLAVLVFLGIGMLLGFDKSLPVLLEAFEQNKSFMLLAVGCQVMSLTCLWLRWHFIVSSAVGKVKASDTFVISLAGSAVNNITPSARMGGEAIKAMMLNKFAKVRTGLSTSTIVSEKIFDGIVFCSISVLAVYFSLSVLPAWVIGVVLIALVFALLLLAIALELSFNKRAGEKLIRWIFRKFGGLINRFWSLESVKKHTFEGLLLFNAKTRKALRKKNVWFYGIFFSLMTWVFDILRSYFIFKSLGLEVGIATIAIVLVLSGLVGSLPLFPGGLGSMEPVMIIIYTSSGLSLAAAGMQTLLDRTLSFWLTTVLGLGAAYHAGIKLDKVNSE